MFKKYKQLIIGFILGAVLFGTVPVSATVQEYLLQKSNAKLIVDGKEFANKDLPMLNYKGSNYIPVATFRDICNTVGIGFEWVGVRNEVHISTGRNITVQPVKEITQPIEEKKGGSMTTIEKDGYKLLVVDGVEYISLIDIMDKYKGYEFRYKNEPKIAYFAYNPTGSNSTEKQKILIDNIPIIGLQGLSHMEYGFFKENIIPLI